MGDMILRIYGDGDSVKIVVRDPERDAGTTVVVGLGDFSLANALGAQGREVKCVLEAGYELPPS